MKKFNTFYLNQRRNVVSNITEIVKNNMNISQSKTLKDTVYEAMRRTIILGDIPAGSRINELEFAESLNISRTPIRYALEELQKENLVERIPGVGTVVIGISTKDAYEIFDIRKALDSLATVSAMNKMTDQDFEDLEALLNRGEEYNRQGQVESLLQNFSDFNAFIYEKAGMPRLKDISIELQTYLIYFRDISIRAEERRSIALEEHWLIYRGMCNKDEDQVRMITDEHLNHSLNFILEEMESRDID